MATFEKVLILDEHEEIIWKHALSVFKTDEAVQEFILEPNKELGWYRPIDVIQSEQGMINVTKLINSLK
jgi:uncharacterized protein (DUF2384 family)